jgi:hypothetical protein
LEDVKTCFDNFRKDVPEKIKYGICCHALTEIDDPDEQEKLAKNIAKLLEKTVPLPYRFGYFLVEGLVEDIARYMLKKAANMLDDSFCKGVVCIEERKPAFPDPRVKRKTVAETVEIIHAGGGIVLDTKYRSTNDLMKIATASAKKDVKVILTSLHNKSVAELVSIANAGRGNIIFELDACTKL